MLITGVNIEGDLVLRVPVERRTPVGLERVTWAWRALRGKSYERELGVVISDCIIGKRLNTNEVWPIVGNRNDDRNLTP